MKLDVGPLRYLVKEDFDVLSAIEMGSRNHKVVPLSLVGQLSKMSTGGIYKAISELQRLKLVTKEPSKKGNYEGVILGYGGYDYLALRTLSSRGTVAGVGRQIGSGKESDIYEVFCGQEHVRFPCVMKIQRLGRTSFRSVKNNRDYIGKRQHYSWLYLSKLATCKEYAFMTALYQHGFPVPAPVDSSRHILVMEQIIGVRLSDVKYEDIPGDGPDEKLEFAAGKRQECLELIVRFAQHGLVHGDFNEFNILLEEGSLGVFVIDFPQMISVSHPNANKYFSRDVGDVCTFFERRFGLQPIQVPNLSDVKILKELDKQLHISCNQNRAKEFEDGEDEEDGEEDGACFGSDVEAGGAE